MLPKLELPRPMITIPASPTTSQEILRFLRHCLGEAVFHAKEGRSAHAAHTPFVPMPEGQQQEEEQERQVIQ